MCICSSKYGSPIKFFFNQKARKDLAKKLPTEIQKRFDMAKKPHIAKSFSGTEASTIFIKGNIHTMNEKQPTVEAVALYENLIVFAGKEEEALKLKTPQTTVIDLGGRTMFPGFIDPHIHMMFALFQDWLDLGPYVNSNMDEVKSRLVEGIKNHKDLNILLAAQLFDPQVTDGELDVSRKGLDSLSQTVPIFILEGNGHVAHVNSAAFKLAKVDESTPDPDYGRLIRDENGVLTGQVQETAINLFKAYFPPVTGEQYVTKFKEFLKMCASKGCTSLHDCSIGNGDPEGDLAVLYTVIREGAPTRYSGYLVSTQWDKWQELKMVPENKDPNLRINGVKCWSDGSTQAGSAYLRDDYLLTQWGSGHPNYSPEQLYKAVKVAHDAGWQVGIHANGDAGIDMALDAFESVQKQNPNFALRHRIQHSTICLEEHLEKMKVLEVSPSFLIGHIYYYGQVFQRILGEERAFRTDPVNSAYKNGLKPTLHSDYNCQPVDPLRCIYNAVTRKVKPTGKILNAEQCVTPYQAVQAMTINAAWQCHMEDIVGSIEVGKMADFVILEEDPLKVDPDQIINIKIHSTWMDGKITYKA